MRTCLGNNHLLSPNLEQASEFGHFNSKPAASIASNGWSQIRSSPQAAWHDIREKGWRNLLLGFIAVCWTLVVTLTFSGLLLGTIPPVLWSPCGQGDDFDLYDQSYYQIWQLKGFFQINLVAGRMSFTVVKAIDVAWDIVIGRGGQWLLIGITWRVFGDYIALSMITKPVTFSTFFVTYLKKDASLTSIYRITRDFSTCLALRSRMASYFLVTTLLFCLAFPTLAGSMTGYTAPTQAFVQKADNTKTPLGDVQYVLYTIHDGERINLTNNHIVAAISEDWSSTEPRGEVINMTRLSRNTQSPFDVSAMPIRSNSLLVQTSTYVAHYGFLGKTQTNTLWNGTLLDGPALNVSAFYIPDLQPARSSSVGQGGGNFPLLFGHDEYPDKKNATFSVAGELQTVSYVQSKSGMCQPSFDPSYPGLNYQWGFSFLQLFIVLLLLILWTIGIFAMYVSNRHRLAVLGRDVQISSSWEACVQLAQAVENRLTDLEVKNEFGSSLEAVKQGKDAIKGGSLASNRCYLLEDVAQPHLGHTIRKWLREEMYWLGAFVVVDSGLITLLIMLGSVLFGRKVGAWPVIMVIGNSFLALALILAVLVVGQSARSRVLLFVMSHGLFGICHWGVLRLLQLPA